MLQENYDIINMGKNLGDLVEIVKKSEKHIFAVSDNKEKFAGIIELNDIKQKIFQPDQFEKVLVKSIMKKPPAILQYDDNMHNVMEKFDITQSWYLPVIDRERNFIGFISKTKLFNKYREILSR